MLFASQTSCSSTSFCTPDTIPLITDTQKLEPGRSSRPCDFEYLLIFRRQIPEFMYVEVRRDVAIQVAPASAVGNVPKLVPCPAIDLLDRGRLEQVTTHCPQRNAGVIDVAVRVNPCQQRRVAVEVL